MKRVVKAREKYLEIICKRWHQMHGDQKNRDLQRRGCKSEGWSESRAINMLLISNMRGRSPSSKRTRQRLATKVKLHILVFLKGHFFVVVIKLLWALSSSEMLCSRFEETADSLLKLGPILITSSVKISHCSFKRSVHSYMRVSNQQQPNIRLQTLKGSGLVRASFLMI